MLFWIALMYAKEDRLAEHVNMCTGQKCVLVGSTHLETELKILKCGERAAAPAHLDTVLLMGFWKSCALYFWQCGECSTHKFPTSMYIHHVHS